MLGLAHAVGALESRVQLPFLLMLGDIYFHLKAPLRPLCDQVLSGEVNANLVSMTRCPPSANGGLEVTTQIDATTGRLRKWESA